MAGFILLQCPDCGEVGTMAFLNKHLRYDHDYTAEEAYDAAGAAEPMAKEKEQPF